MISSAPKLVHWQSEVQNYLSAMPESPLIAVLGPTASGKTAFSIKLAKALQALGKTAEVINADSRQIYTFFDIGTAKITAEEMQGVPHHLLSVLDPKEPCSIAWYIEHATKCIRDVQARGNIPLLVGGSMLYISAVIDGLQPIAPSDPLLREKLTSEYDEDGGKTSFKRLMDTDPASANIIPRENKAYVIRALEIYESTGKPKSEQLRHETVPYDLLLFGMYSAREELISRINKRTKQMFASGWIDEVRTLDAMGYRATDPAMQSHGYKEILACIKTGEGDEEALCESIAAQGRRYAKRAMTWWRNDPRIRWVLRSDALQE